MIDHLTFWVAVGIHVWICVCVSVLRAAADISRDCEAGAGEFENNLVQQGDSKLLREWSQTHGTCYGTDYSAVVWDVNTFT